MGERTGREAVYVPASAALPSWSPYVAGVGLGLTLLLSFCVLGVGLGGSGGVARFAVWAEHAVAPGRVEASPCFGEWFRPAGRNVLGNYLVFAAIGIAIGALLSAAASQRVRPSVERGPRITTRGRLWFALVGGIVVGFAARLARGDLMDQGIAGATLLLTGSVVFLIAFFFGAFVMALFARREWL